MFRSFILAFCFLVFAASAQTAFAAKRIALVVGNNLYENFPDFRQLKKAVNDAEAISQTLKTGLDFDVRLLLDSSYTEFNQAIKEVESEIEQGSVVFFYFSGHGVAIDGANYLLPSDVPQPILGEEQRLSGASFAAEQIIARFQKKGAKAVFAVLDACRDNPFENEAGKSVGGGGGLTKMDAAEGVFILFAAGVGQTALDRLSEDDANPNSVFTRNLLPLLETDGLSQVDLAKKLYSKVKKDAASIGHDQHPAYYDQIEGYISLGKASVADPNKTDVDGTDPADVDVALADPAKKDLVVVKKNPAEAQKELDAIFDASTDFKKAGDAKAYVAAGKKAQSLASVVFGDRSIQYGQASYFMIGALDAADDPDGAIRAAKTALRIYEEELGSGHPRVGDDKGKLAKRLLAARKYREADKILSEALTHYGPKNPGNGVYINMSEDDFVVLARLYSGQAQLRLEQDRPKDALRMSEKSQKIISAISDKVFADHGIIFTQHAQVLKLTGNCDEAQSFFKQAVKAFKSAKTPVTQPDYAVATKESAAQC
jgi:tetratricopeptide (TPR) repeat protein